MAFQGDVASFSTTDLKAGVGEFTAVVNWGDGQTSQATIVANGAGPVPGRGQSHVRAGRNVLGDHDRARQRGALGFRHRCCERIGPAGRRAESAGSPPRGRRSSRARWPRSLAPRPPRAGDFSASDQLGRWVDVRRARRDHRHSRGHEVHHLRHAHLRPAKLLRRPSRSWKTALPRPTCGS